MSKFSHKGKTLKLQIMDLLIQLSIPAGVAEEVASEVVKKATKDISTDTIRFMILESLRVRDAPAAKELANRFEYVKQGLTSVQLETVEPGGEIYDEKALDELLEADEITAAELYFMEGFEGRAWRRKVDHFDSVSTDLAREDRYDD